MVKCCLDNTTSCSPGESWVDRRVDGTKSMWNAGNSELQSPDQHYLEQLRTPFPALICRIDIQPAAQCAFGHLGAAH